jgi:hypothetical protein
MDQPTTVRGHRPDNDSALHSKFMTSGAAKSLTRSAERLDMGGNGHGGKVNVGVAEA